MCFSRCLIGLRWLISYKDTKIRSTQRQFTTKFLFHKLTVEATRSLPQGVGRRNATLLNSTTLLIFFTQEIWRCLWYCNKLNAKTQVINNKWQGWQSAGKTAIGVRSCFFGTVTSNAVIMMSPAADRDNCRDGRKPLISKSTAQRFWCMSLQQNRIPHLTSWPAWRTNEQNKAIGDCVFGRFSNCEKCRSTVAEDVISDVAAVFYCILQPIGST